MTSSETQHLITPEELLRMPDADRFELVNGHLVELHSSRISSQVAMTISRLLGNEVRKTSAAEIYGSDLGYQCFKDSPGLVRKPDISVIRKERLAVLSGDVGYMPLPADLAVEVVSPNDLASELMDKIEEYLEAGFATVWVVHPSRKTVTVYRSDRSAMIIGENMEISGEPALPSFRCRVSEFF